MTVVIHLYDTAPRFSSFLAGVVAAGLGLGSATALVMVLWVSSPYPDSGPSGALHMAASLWLLAHGVELVRTETLSGGPAPVGLTPLLLTAVTVWLLHRAARDALETSGPTRVLTVWGGVVVGHLTVAGPVTAYAAGGELRPSWVGAGVWLPVVVALAAGAGVAGAGGLPPRWVVPDRVRRLRDLFEPALRAAGAGIAVLAGGGAVLVAVAVVWHGPAVRAAFGQLTEGWSGRIAVLLLCLALVPNAAVWAMAYALGPGFLLGAGHGVGPFGTASAPLLPAFPLLAAVPEAGPGGWAHRAVGLVPLAGGVALAWGVLRAAVPRRGAREAAWPAARTAQVTGLAALLAGAGCAGLAALAGGRLGVGALAEFGPVWWLTGAGAAGWFAVTGLPVALGVRAWRVRGTRRGFRAHAQRLRTGLRTGLPRLPSPLRGWRHGEPNPVPVVSVPAAGTAGVDGGGGGEGGGGADRTDGTDRTDGVDGVDGAEGEVEPCDFLVQDRDPFQAAGEAAPAIGDPPNAP